MRVLFPCNGVLGRPTGNNRSDLERQPSGRRAYEADRATNKLGEENSEVSSTAFGAPAINSRGLHTWFRSALKLAHRRMTMLAYGVMLSGLAACTTSLANLPESATAGDLPASGIPYRLPATQVSVTVSWTVDKCTPAPEPEDDDEEDAKGAVEFAASGIFTTASIEGESRIIDYGQLNKPFKTGSIKVDYHDKTMFIKSINADIKGKEAEAVGSALKFGANVARLLIGLPAPAATGGTKEGNSTPCLDATVDMVDALKAAQGRIKAIPAEAKRIEDRIAVLRSRVAGGKLTDADEKELESLQTQSDEITTELSELKASSERLKARLTYTTSFLLPTASTDRTATAEANEEKLQKWLRSLLKPTPAGEVSAKDFTAYAALQPLVAEAACKTPCVATDPQPGFVFRQPVAASLIVTVPSDPKPVISETIAVAQFGRLRVLPLVSGWGENNSLSATFDVDGRPTMVEYKALAAPGVDAINVVNDGASTLLALAGEIEKQQLADETEALAKKKAEEKAELDALIQQVSLLEAQAKIDKLQQPTAPDVETLSAELAVLRLQKEKAELEAAIRKATLTQ